MEGDALRLRIFDDGSHLLASHSAVEGPAVREFELSVLLTVRRSRRASEDASGAEGDTGHLLAQLCVTCIPLLVGRTLPQNHGLEHRVSSRSLRAGFAAGA